MHPQITIIVLILNVLAVWRCTRIVTEDQILKRPRDWFISTYKGSLVYFITCNWCVSIWLGAGAAVLTYYCWGWWQWACLALAASVMTGFMSEHA